MNKSFLLFDFDGVLTDSFQEAFTVTKLHRPWLTDEAYRDLFMGNVYEELEKKADLESYPVVEHTEDEFFAKYFELTKKLGVIPQMREIIPTLALSHQLSVVSSAYSYIITEMLERENLLHHFSVILGSDIETSKTKKIQMIFDRYGVNSSQTLFITDTAGDVKEARKLNVDSIAVTWGYHDALRLASVNPFALVHTPRELLETIQKR